jgi:tRNA(Ile2) C34 agmatinyltransferase TiaS
VWYDLRRFMTGKNFKITAEIVNGICPTCDEYTPLVGITKQYFRCLTCGSDLEQKVNGVISYIPHLSKNSLKSQVDQYFDGEA